MTPYPHAIGRRGVAAAEAPPPNFSNPISDVAEISSRTQAKAAGHIRYFTGLLCSNGHRDERLVSNGSCLSCSREKVAKARAAQKKPKLISARAAALAAGQVRYTTGKPCPHGHTGERFASSGRCCACADEGQKVRIANDPQAHRDRNRKWNTENRDKRRAMTRPLNANRRASQLNRTPAWLTAEDKRKIKVKHAEARWMTAHTGIAHAVDHFYPLQGEFVSGLHVPWNMRVIPARENSKKHNKMPTTP